MSPIPNATLVVTSLSIAGHCAVVSGGEHLHQADPHTYAGHVGARIVYIGDHMHGDVAACRGLGWQTICVAEELEVSEPADVSTRRLTSASASHCESGALGPAPSSCRRVVL